MSNRSEMRVALVWLNAAGPPGVSHGLLVLARELVDAGHVVTVHHVSPALGMPMEPEVLAEALSLDSPALVGLSFASPDAPMARRLSDQIRSRLPQSLILCGGIHTTLDPEGVFAWPSVDGIGLGELDGGHLANLVDRLARGERPTDVKGFWLRWEGKEYRNPLAPLPSLAPQSIPLFEGLDLDRLVQLKRGFGEVLSGRGCPYRCRFCQNEAVVRRYRSSLGTPSSSWPYVRKRDLDGLMAELREMKARAPSLRAIMFGDDRMVDDREWLRAFAQRYPLEIGLPFVVNATPDQVNRETVSLLREAGCNMVKLGVECAPGPRRRKVLGRPEGEHRIRTAFTHLRKAGINTMAYLMIGIPGETPETLADTFRFCASLQPDAVRVAMFCPYPSTRLFEELVASGQIEPDSASRGFTESSALEWPPETGRLLCMAPRLLPWLLNQHLPAASEASANLVAWALAHGGASTEEPARFPGELASRENALWVRFRERGLPHYTVPFPERPDYAFLLAARPQPIINVDAVTPS